MSRCIIGGTWDRAPHLTAEKKEALYGSIEPYQLLARTKGIPQLGSGVIYPFPESEIRVDPFKIPDEWPRGMGLDVGWNYTAMVWAARNPQTGTRYVYSVYKGSKDEPSTHIVAARNRGIYIPCRIDPASKGKSQRDGLAIIDDYKSLGLPVTPAINAVNAGIGIVYRGYKTGTIRVFSSCIELFSEYRAYIRDEMGKVVKGNDHIMDGKRYLFAGGDDWWELPPRDALTGDVDSGDPSVAHSSGRYSGPQSWMA